MCGSYIVGAIHESPERRANTVRPYNVIVGFEVIPPQLPRCKMKNDVLQ